MGSAKLTKTKDGITLQINTILGRVRTIPAYLNRVAYPQYQQAQATRWETENTSETGQWAALSEPYATRKIKKFSSFPGGGRALMVATGKLSMAAQGRGGGALKIISGEGMTVGIDDSYIPYGKWAAEARPIMSFSDATAQGIADGVAAYVMRG